MTTAIRADVYQRITDRIVTDLEAGVRPWLRPWNAEHAAGRITRPLRANGVAYRGINVIALWMEAARNAGFLQRDARSCADAALRNVPRRRKLLRHAFT